MILVQIEKPITVSTNIIFLINMAYVIEVHGITCVIEVIVILNLGKDIERIIIGSATIEKKMKLRTSNKIINCGLV